MKFTLACVLAVAALVQGVPVPTETSLSKPFIPPQWWPKAPHDAPVNVSTHKHVARTSTEASRNHPYLPGWWPSFLNESPKKNVTRTSTPASRHHPYLPGWWPSFLNESPKKNVTRTSTEKPSNKIAPKRGHPYLPGWWPNFNTSANKLAARSFWPWEIWTDPSDVRRSLNTANDFILRARDGIRDWKGSKDWEDKNSANTFARRADAAVEAMDAPPRKCDNQGKAWDPVNQLRIQRSIHLLAGEMQYLMNQIATKPELKNTSYAGIVSRTMSPLKDSINAIFNHCGQHILQSDISKMLQDDQIKTNWFIDYAASVLPHGTPAPSPYQTPTPYGTPAQPETLVPEERPETESLEELKKEEAEAWDGPPHDEPEQYQEAEDPWPNAYNENFTTWWP